MSNFLAEASLEERFHQASKKAIMLVDNFKIDGPNVTFSENEINSTYEYQTSSVERSSDGSSWTVRPKSTSVQFKTDTRVPKLGCVLTFSNKLGPPVANMHRCF